MTNPLALHDVDNEMLKDADDYLRKHKILELFEVSLMNVTLQDLTTLLAYKQPESVDQLLVD